MTQSKSLQTGECMCGASSAVQQCDGEFPGQPWSFPHKTTEQSKVFYFLIEYLPENRNKETLRDSQWVTAKHDCQMRCRIFPQWQSCPLFSTGCLSVFWMGFLKNTYKSNFSALSFYSRIIFHFTVTIKPGWLGLYAFPSGPHYPACVCDRALSKLIMVRHMSRQNYF